MKTASEVNGLGKLKPVAFQFVGFKNSGKTTLLSKLVNKLTTEDWTVITVKHHGHGGKPDFPKGKDTSLHIEAGAYASLVAGGGRMILQVEQEGMSLKDQIELLSFFKVDFLLIEGHKQEDYPKAVLLRNQNDLELLKKLENIVVVFFWEDELKANLEGIPHFHIYDEAGQYWLKNYLTDYRLSAMIGQIQT